MVLPRNVNLCDLHLVYLGFGAFLCLVPRPALDTKECNLPILGHVVGEDPETQMELTRKAIKEEKIDEPTNSRIATAAAAAGSALQLSRVERELSMPQTMLLSSSSTSTDKPKHTSYNLLALCKPMIVKLTRLSKSEIEEHQSSIIKLKSSHTSSVQTCTVKIWKLPLGPNQSVHLKQFSQFDRDEKSVSQKPIWKLTLIHHKRFAKCVTRCVHIFNVQRHVLK